MLMNVSKEHMTALQTLLPVPILSDSTAVVVTMDLWEMGKQAVSKVDTDTHFCLPSDF